MKEPDNYPSVENDSRRTLDNVNDTRGLDNRSAPVHPLPVPADLSWQKRQEKELIDAKAEAELYLDLFSHDIRNLTQIAVGYIELAQESADIDEIKTLMAKALDAMQDTAHIIENVRKLQDTHRGNLKRTSVDLCAVLADIRSQEIAAARRDVTINLQTGVNCLVKANEMVTEVFSNLINNAIRHSDPEKPLTVNIKVSRIKEKDVDRLRCAVDDNGPGISNWVKDKIFMRFQRGDTKAR